MTGYTSALLQANPIPLTPEATDSTLERHRECSTAHRAPDRRLLPESQTGRPALFVLCTACGAVNGVRVQKLTRDARPAGDRDFLEHLSQVLRRKDGLVPDLLATGGNPAQEVVVLRAERVSHVCVGPELVELVIEGG